MIWAMPHKAWNKLMHALHGNGTLIRRMYTEGLPILEGNTPEDFIHWTIDLEGWTAMNGSTSSIIGPAGHGATAEDLADGLRYLCAAIRNQHLRAATAQAGNGRGPDGYAFLRRKFLQGAAEQPIIQRMIDNLSLGAGEDILPFEMQYTKLVNALNPRPSDYTISTKFHMAVTKDTGSLYEDCVSSAVASSDLSNFDEFSAK